jgi:hypothetical protein
MSGVINELVAGEVNRIARYCDRVVQVDRLSFDDGHLLSLIDCAEKQCLTSSSHDAGSMAAKVGRTAILLNGNLNHHHDIQGLLHSLYPFLKVRVR